MFLLTIIKSEKFVTEFTALVGALIIALILFALYNSSYIIRKKTRAEAIQKLKLDSMIEIINGTEELQSAIDQVNEMLPTIINNIVASIIHGGDMSAVEVKSLLIATELKFRTETKESRNIINNYILSLKKDMILNGENEEVRKEIKKIAGIHNKIQMFIIELDTQGFFAGDKKDLIKNIDNNRSKAFDKLIKFEAPNKIGKSIGNLWNVYKEKLDKEQEGRLDKLLNYFKGDRYG